MNPRIRSIRRFRRHRHRLFIERLMATLLRRANAHSMNDR
jgi:hypothetical protein